MLSSTAADERWERLNAFVAAAMNDPQITLVAASEDASFRRYFRFYQEKCSYVVMDAPPALEPCDAFVAIANQLRKAGLPAPQIHAADLQHGFLLLEDFGPRSLLDTINTINANTAVASDSVAKGLTGVYQSALDLLLRMQTKAPATGLPNYDQRLINDELALFPDWFMTHHLQLQPDAEFDRVFGACSDALVAVFAEQPQLFVHRDYHSRNLMHGADGALGLLDFQDAAKGPLTYDLVSLLRDVYVAWPRQWVEQWTKRYWLQWSRCEQAKGRAAIDWETYLRWFDLTGVQRYLKVAGIFARLYHRDGKAQYLSHLEYIVESLLDVSRRYPATAPLARLLQRPALLARLTDANRKAGSDGAHKAPRQPPA